MYTVYVDGVLVHNPQSPDVRVHLGSPVLKMQENTAGSFECDVYPDSVGYDLFKRITSLVVVKKDNRIIWTGRPLKESTNFKLVKKITCEGALAFLNDTLQDPVEYSNANVRYIFRKIIEAHNSKVEVKRRFTVGIVDVADFDDSYIYETRYDNTWTTIKSHFIDRLIGHLIVRYDGNSTTPILDYTTSYNRSQQNINFGQNLLDFTKDYDLSDLFTVIFPRGKEITSDSDDSDASDDANPVTTSKTTSANGATIAYDIIKSDLRLTVKIRSLTYNNTIKYKGGYTFSIAIGDVVVVSKKASSSSHLDNGRTIVTYQPVDVFMAVAANALNTKIQQDTAKATFSRGAKNTSENLMINVLGKSVTIKISIPKREDTAGYLMDTERKEYTTVASVNNGSVYVQNDAAVSTYGRIEKVIDFSEVDNPKLLLSLAKTYLRAVQFDQMTLRISAVDLHVLDSDVQSFELFDQVRCISAPHGMDKVFPITEVTISLDSPDKNKYTLGKVASTSMSSQSAANATTFYGALEHIPSLKNTLDSAKNDMTAILNRRTNGYVNIVQENDISQALVISDTANWLEATKVWKFDINGLGYSDTNVEDVNYDGPSAVADGRWYKMGMTMDGTIVADIIKTGILEDGMGYNYWNLSTGEFSLQPNTVVLDNDYTIADLKTDLNNTKTTANTAKNTADATKTDYNKTKTRFELVEGKQYGVTNLLNGTYAPVIKALSKGGGSWKNSTWRSADTGNGKRTVINCTRAKVGANPPNQWLSKCIRIQGSTNKKIASVRQDDIELLPNTVYVMSCYVIGTGKLYMAAGSSIVKNSTTYNKYVKNNPEKMPSNNRKKWKRYSFVFKTGANNDTDASNVAGIADNTMSVIFGNAGISSSEYLIIAGMKLEKGNTATDWFPSVTDIDKNAQTYTREFVKTNVPKETKKQIKAYDRLLKGAKVLKKLTKGYSHVGIYSKKISGESTPSLLINATYIRSGAMDAKVIRTGWIRDSKKNNQWNLTTGYFKTKYMVAKDMTATGMFTTGTKKDFAIQLSTGSIHGYKKGSWVGCIDTTANMYDLNSRRWESGLRLRATGCIDIRSPHISVRTANDDGVALTAYTGTLVFDTVESIEDAGGGSIRWTTVTHTIDVRNGLIVSIA